MAKITWTRTDEAPLLATYSLKPIVEAFASTAGIDVETRDISPVSYTHLTLPTKA